MSEPLALITGGSGYLGALLARRYLERSDHGVVLLVRAGDAAALSQRQTALDRALGGASGRVRCIAGDLADEHPFAGVAPPLASLITHIVHAGAVTRFNAERTLALEVNVEGTAKTLDFARRCPALESFGQVSTVYASGLRAGRIAEAPADDRAGYANHYEWSKAQAEQLVVERAGDLPWRILRVATVIADDDSGAVTQHNAFHETMKLCFYGLLSLLPGRADTPCYFVTGEFAADALFQLMGRAEAKGVYHIAHARRESLTLSGVLDNVFSQFEAVEEFRRRRILRPLLADEQSFDLLVEGVRSFGGGFVTQALDNVAPFARQLYVSKDVDNSRLRAALADYRAPDPAALVRRTCATLAATRWGRRDAVA